MFSKKGFYNTALNKNETTTMFKKTISSYNVSLINNKTLFSHEDLLMNFFLVKKTILTYIKTYISRYLLNDYILISQTVVR